MADLVPEKTNITPVPFFSGKRNAWFPWLPAILCALAGALLMPKDDPFPYKFKTGRLWHYPDFYAPFDIAVMPDGNSGSDTVKKQVTPFYVIDPEIARQQKLKLAELIQDQVKISGQDSQYEDLVGNPGAYKNYGTRLLDYIYERGVVQLRPDNVDFVVLVAPTARPIPVDSLLLIDDAVGIVTDSLPFSPLRQPELLLPILEKVLVPNAFYSDSLTANDQGHAQNPDIQQISFARGELILKNNATITANDTRVLTEISARYERTSNWKILSGYLIFSIVGYLSLMGWLLHFKKRVFIDRNKVLTILVTVLGIQLLIAVCYRVGIVVPFLLPLFLLPLMLRPMFRLRTSLVVWSVPVMLTGFALSWGVLWISMQIVGAGTALMLNDNINSWRQRILALVSIFSAQSLIWLAYWLAGKLPDALNTPDAIIFLAISGLLSISRSVLARFFQQI